MSQPNLNTLLGSDIAFPINGTFNTISGLDVLLQDIQLLLLTVPGERVNHPTFGCNLLKQIWENIDDAAAKGAASIRAAITKFEPRVNLLSVQTTINRNTGLIIFKVNFIILNTDTVANLIFPFRFGTALSFA